MIGVENENGPLSDDEIEIIVSGIRARKLEIPAIFFLELHKPLATVISTASIVSFPVVAALFGRSLVDRVYRLLGDRAAVEKLIIGLETIERGSDGRS